MFPTPLASDKFTGRNAANLDVFRSEQGVFYKRGRDGKIWSLSLSTAIFYLTPEVQNPELALNPDWVEWLMGFPPKWTDASSGKTSPPTSPA